MKTSEIKKSIANVRHLVSEKLARESEAELAAIDQRHERDQVQIAAKNEAICHAISEWYQCAELGGKWDRVRHILEAALTPDSGNLTCPHCGVADGIHDPVCPSLTPDSGKVPTDRERFITLAKAASRACDVMSEALDCGLADHTADWHEMKAAKEGILDALLGVSAKDLRAPLKTQPSAPESSAS